MEWLDGNRPGDLLAGLNEVLDDELGKARAGRLECGVFRPEDTRAQLRCSIGVVDQRVPFEALEFISTTKTSSLVGEGSAYEVHVVRWPVLKGVDGEGLLLQPKGDVRCCVVALPDCDWTPEMAVGLTGELPQATHFARRLAELGCLVVAPTLIDRSDTYAGNPSLGVMTNQPHREYVYRMAYEMGRHIIGYEIQKVLSLIDVFGRQYPHVPVGVYGFGEGGLLALHAGALDPRIDAVGVSGYFTDHHQGWDEPIYRNVWRRCRGLGNAGLAACIAPRSLVIEASPSPTVEGPPAAKEGRRDVAAPGALKPASLDDVRHEAALAKDHFTAVGCADKLRLVIPTDQDQGPGTPAALAVFSAALGLEESVLPEASTLEPRGVLPDPALRQQRQFEQLCQFTLGLADQSAARREAFFSDTDSSSLHAWEESVKPYREYMANEVIGHCPVPSTPMRPWSQQIEETTQYKLSRVELRIWPNVPNYGYLLVPQGMRDGERRAVVVCQHGLGGQPEAVLDSEGIYAGFARRLAEEGYVVYAPQNPYIGPRGREFRVLQLKANALGWTLFTLITVQHQRILEWLGTLPFVDADRIGFYGLSYGGKTAMRVPALLKGYVLSICSGDFNEWIMKNVRTDLLLSYMFTEEYEMFEFNLGHTFNYAEMAALIAPRPFMVERGHQDGVAYDEWVAFEYAKVRRLYAELGIPERTEIEFFQGGHQINLKGTLDFLKRHLPAHR